MKSWRTTLCGVAGICAGAVTAADFGPLATKIAGCVAMAANGIGLMFARDSAVSKATLEALNGQGRVPIKRGPSFLPLVLASLLAGVWSAGGQESRPVAITFTPETVSCPAGDCVRVCAEVFQLGGETLWIDYAFSPAGPWYENPPSPALGPRWVGFCFYDHRPNLPPALFYRIRGSLDPQF